MAEIPSQDDLVGTLSVSNQKRARAGAVEPQPRFAGVEKGRQLTGIRRAKARGVSLLEWSITARGHNSSYGDRRIAMLHKFAVQNAAARLCQAMQDDVLLYRLW